MVGCICPTLTPTSCPLPGLGFGLLPHTPGLVLSSSPIHIPGYELQTPIPHNRLRTLSFIFHIGLRSPHSQLRTPSFISYIRLRSPHPFLMTGYELLPHFPYTTTICSPLFTSCIRWTPGPALRSPPVGVGRHVLPGLREASQVHRG